MGALLLRRSNNRMDLQTPQLNPADLYEKRKAKDSGRLRAYNRILGAVYHRIRTISRLPQGTSYLLYQVPPFVLGVPKLDLEDLSVYLIFQLRHAGFMVRFTPPNLLYVDWSHHEKSYLTEQSPIMMAMLDSAEKTQAEIERKEHEASRLLAPRKSGKKVRIQEPGYHQSRAIPSAPAHVGPSRSAMDMVLGRTPSMAQSSQSSQSSPSAGAAPSAGAYTPNPSFLNSVMNPASTNQKVKSVQDYFR